MTAAAQSNVAADVATGEKEVNLRQMREKYERELEQERQKSMQERQKRLELEAALQEKSAPVAVDDDSEPYIDKKRLQRELQNVKKETKQETQTEIQRAVGLALAEERQKNWLKAHPDFYEIMQHAQKLQDKDPEWGEAFLEMPEGFERNKLVYKTIKNAKLHVKEEPAPVTSMNVNQPKSMYYNPSGVGTAPYASQGDFSPAGQKNAHTKMKELQARFGGR